MCLAWCNICLIILKLNINNRNANTMPNSAFCGIISINTKHLWHLPSISSYVNARKNTIFFNATNRVAVNFFSTHTLQKNIAFIHKLCSIFNICVTYNTLEESKVYNIILKTIRYCINKCIYIRAL